MTLPTITVVGNLVADPELKFTGSGAAVAKLRIAASERKKDDQGNWVDGDTTFINVTAWRQLAENAADSVRKGDEVIVTGRLRSRTVENADGTKQTYFDVDADTLGASLRRAAATLTRVSRSSGTQAIAGDDDPWAVNTPTKAFDEVPF